MFELTAWQIGLLRDVLAVPDGERDPDVADLAAVLTAEQIVEAEDHRWTGLDTGDG
jgi:hypothetical protein